MTMFDEWPTIEFPQFLRDLGFEDHSYHNDLCAIAWRPLPGYDVGAGYPILAAVCEHEKPEDREVDNFPRFEVSVCMRGPLNVEEGEIIYSGEDAHACETAIRAWLTEAGL